MNGILRNSFKINILTLHFTRKQLRLLEYEFNTNSDAEKFKTYL